jgi:hypothetical protein
MLNLSNLSKEVISNLSNLSNEIISNLSDEVLEGTGVSKEYCGDQGRYLPPKGGRPVPQDHRGERIY